MNWATNYPARFQRELQELDRLESEVDWLSTSWSMTESGLITVDLDFSIHGQIFAGRMTYPVTFPDSPPYICPRNISERWSAHQYGEGGPLCLEWRPDNWHSEVSGAEMVRSAHKLLNTEKHPELPQAVPSAHRLTSGQRLRVECQRLVFTAESLICLLKLPLPSKTPLKSTVIFSTSGSVMFITNVADADGMLQQVSDIPEGITASNSLLALLNEGWMFRNDVFDQQRSIDSVEELMQFISDSGFFTEDILIQEEGSYKARTIVILGKNVTSLRVFRINSGTKPGLQEYTIVDPSFGSRLSEEAQQLARIRVGIVGLGSVGSKVAISLARSGIRRFLLVDDDYLSPDNMVRHDLSWAYVGTHKAKAIGDALLLTAAGVKVETKPIRLAGQESAAVTAETLRDLSDCDLLIDATANPEVFLILAALAKRHRKPLCWGEIFAGGCGGMIARARPFRDPNPLAVRDAFHNYLESEPDAPFKSAAGYDGSEEQPMVAYDSDVGYIAAALTRLAIDTALSRDPSEFPCSLYLLGMRSEWIFKAPFDTYPIDLHGQGWECHDSVGSEEDRRAVEGILEKMKNEGPHAEPDAAN